MTSSSHSEGEWNVALVSAEPSTSESDLSALAQACSALLFRVAGAPEPALSEVEGSRV